MEIHTNRDSHSVLTYVPLYKYEYKLTGVQSNTSYIFDIVGTVCHLAMLHM